VWSIVDDHVEQHGVRSAYRPGCKKKSRLVSELALTAHCPAFCDLLLAIWPLPLPDTKGTWRDMPSSACLAGVAHLLRLRTSWPMASSSDLMRSDTAASVMCERPWRPHRNRRSTTATKASILLGVQHRGRIYIFLLIEVEFYLTLI
jgi:hypothetical protein